MTYRQLKDLNSSYRKRKGEVLEKGVGGWLRNDPTFENFRVFDE
jgi:hypothetical protein